MGSRQKRIETYILGGTLFHRECLLKCNLEVAAEVPTDSYTVTRTIIFPIALFALLIDLYRSATPTRS